MNKRLLGFIPVPTLIGMIAVLYLTVNPLVRYDPGWLIAITNTLFVGLICFAVAYISMRNYRLTGRIQILLLGCGLLIFGIGGVIAGFVRGLPGGANLNVTVYNIGALVGALFHFAAAIILLSGISPEVGYKHKDRLLFYCYGGIIIFMALLTLASFRGMIAPFFIQGVGPTPMRQVILGTADILFAFSFIVFFGTYFRNKEAFLYWYSLALALTSISLTAFFIESSVGSPVGWTGRFSQYLAGVYFLIALLTAIRSAHARKTSLDNIITSSLSPAEEKFRALAENSPDIIDRYNTEMRHIYLNPAGLRLYGKPARSVIGKTIEETGLDEPYCRLWRERIQRVFETGQNLEVEDYFPTSDGLKFYQSLCVPEFGADGAIANVLVISRDLTERRRAEMELERMRGILSEGQRIAHLGSWEYIADTQETVWSEEELRIYGLDPTGPSPVY
jgi:PAS domain S-box-containing protein